VNSFDLKSFDFVKRENRFRRENKTPYPGFIIESIRLVTRPQLEARLTQYRCSWQQFPHHRNLFPERRRSWYNNVITSYGRSDLFVFLFWSTGIVKSSRRCLLDVLLVWDPICGISTCVQDITDLGMLQTTAHSWMDICNLQYILLDSDQSLR
jgi:hypothetical protein